MNRDPKHSKSLHGFSDLLQLLSHVAQSEKKGGEIKELWPATWPTQPTAEKGGGDTEGVTHKKGR